MAVKNALQRLQLDVTGLSRAEPQRSGAMTVIPLCGPDRRADIAPPLTGLKITRVQGYGNLELRNPGGQGPAIVPLHIGYIQDGAQNHAMCRAAFIGPGQTVMFEDACCVQETQGGYLKGAEQWFFVLPLRLREHALKLRGQDSYSKLWPAIAVENERHGLPKRGHLEQILVGRRAYLGQFPNRFELVENQRGALVVIGDRLAGIELAPSAAYFAELWMGLLCFCYGTEAMALENKGWTHPAPPALEGADLGELKRSLATRRSRVQAQLDAIIASATSGNASFQDEDAYLDLQLRTVNSEMFVGQLVEDASGPVYASLTATARQLDARVS